MNLTSLNVAAARKVLIDGREVLTAIDKRAVSGRVEVRLLGLAGDEQADLTVHGGLSKAVYAYPSEHYAFWQRVRAQAGVSGGTSLRDITQAHSPAQTPARAPLRDAALPDWSAAEQPLPPGAFGENLTLSGVLESQVWVGDLLRFPDCVLAVSEPRLPCFKFNAAMGFNQAVKLMSQSGWCGFYLAVRVPGTLAAGEPFELLPGPREVGIAELFRARVPPQRG